MVRHAFRVLTEDRVQTRLLAFSDDMDALRKVPDNVPNKEMLAPILANRSRVCRTPSNEYPSFGAANNARLRAFLDRFGFDYEFASSTDYYASGRFDETLLRLLEVYDEVMDIILPTLGPDRRATYSPFLPISAGSGKVLPGADGRARCVARNDRLYRSRTNQRSRRKSPAATSNANGRRTGRCAGPRSASTMRWRARI